MLCIWYPSISGTGTGTGTGTEAAAYLPPAWRPVCDAIGVETDGLRSSAGEGVPMADDHTRYPIVLLSPSGFPPLLLSGTAEQLASHGYIVIGVNHTYETTVTPFSDGRMIPINPRAIAGALGPQTGPHDEAFADRAAVCRYKAADLRFVAEELARVQTGGDQLLMGRLDLSRMGAIGHSFGGCAALQWCRDDPRCRAAVNLDGAVWTDVGVSGLDRPALQLLATHAEFRVTPEQAVVAGMAPDTAWFEAERRRTYGGWRVIDQLSRLSYSFQLAGATHLSFMDVPLLPAGDTSPIKPMIDATAIAPQRALEIIRQVVLAFFARHLDHGPSDLLDNPSTHFPELVRGTP